MGSFSFQKIQVGKRPDEAAFVRNKRILMKNMLKTFSYKGKKVKKAGPSTPVEITGFTEVPEAGEIFYEVENEKVAKHLIEQRKIKQWKRYQ